MRSQVKEIQFFESGRPVMSRYEALMERRSSKRGAAIDPRARAADPSPFFDPFTCNHCNFTKAISQLVARCRRER